MLQAAAAAQLVWRAWYGSVAVDYVLTPPAAMAVAWVAIDLIRMIQII
jgi:hypothetical protein